MEKGRYDELSSDILYSAIAVHKQMGPGLLESVYQQCMVKELSLRNIHLETLVKVPLFYKDFPLSKDYVIDILVENEIIIELKATEVILPVHEAQIISYLKLANKKIRLLNKLQCSIA